MNRSVCERGWGSGWHAGRANWVSGSLIFVTHWNVGEERGYLTPLPDLLPFFLACVPLSPPPPPYSSQRP